MRPHCFPILIFLALLVAGCESATSTTIPVPATASPTNTSPPVSAVTVTSEATPMPTRLSCDEWHALPVVPSVSETMRVVYETGQASGNNPRAFSKVGDGEISTAWFLTAFDLGNGHYDLGPFEDLVPMIEHFSSSFGRIGVAARRGFNTHRILDPALSPGDLCAIGESPLACELRLHRPAFAILSLGTNQVWQPEEFEQGMRQILDRLLSNHIVPVLSTKGDNLEGDHRINRIIACLAQDYDAPLWNFWSAIQPLPNHGLQADLEHLTYGGTDFADERAMQTAWTVRNLTALQVLDAVWRGVTGTP